MKVKYYLLSALLAGSMFASCSDNDEVEKRGGDETGETASLSIQVVGKDTGTRAADAGSTAENAIKDFAVYVFDQNSVLEKSLETTANPALVQKIEDLTTGPKTVVVITNFGVGNYPTITAYSDLASITPIHLDDQNDDITTNGFVMSGEASKTLVKGSTSPENSVSVPVDRVVAKIKLGTVKVAAETGHTGTFVLQNVHIMKGMPYAPVNPGSITGVQGVAPGLYGGLANATYATTEQKGYLASTLPATIEDIEDTPSSIVFYVFPNTTAADATLLTFEGTYDGTTVYYPFRINDLVKTVGDGSGEYIKRNTVHTINVTFKKPGNGSSDPELPLDPTDLEVTVSAAAWKVVPTQEVSW